MPRELGVQELVTLKEIAETLNRSHDLDAMLQAVLQKLLEVTGLQTGWIFLTSEQPSYVCAADCNLPPALSWDEKTPMRRGACWCLSDYWEGSLKQAVNVFSCKRLQDAVRLKWGDTHGITWHATVPLMAAGERFGILNVASPGKSHFTAEELALLESVAYQIGTAVERVRLYQEEQRRAADYTKLGEVSRRLGAILAADHLPLEVVRQAGQAFGWQTVALFLREGADLALRAAYAGGAATNMGNRYAVERAGAPGEALRQGRTLVVADAAGEPRFAPLPGQPPYRSCIAVPLRLRDEPIGVLLVGSDQRRAFADCDVALAQDLGAHVSLALENARLYQQRREIALAEERNRLARDLHDSVTQALFSLMLTARGARNLVATDPALTTEALTEIEDLSQRALKEMRGLIWQLRPAGLEDGLLTALQRYGEGLGLQMAGQVDGVQELPRAVEEALWRIGQEALNNVRKHAQTEHVHLWLRLTDADVSLEVADQGCGFAMEPPGPIGSLGMTSMRERAQALGGTLTVESRVGGGTVIRAWLPCPSREA